MTDKVVVLSTCGSSQEALRIARSLVEERLAACVNVLPPMRSLYRWQGRVHDDREQQLVIKTTASRLARLDARLRQVHPYELPEFLVLRAGASDAYAGWLRDSVRGEDDPG